jgi:hypothetical protein
MYHGQKSLSDEPKWINVSEGQEVRDIDIVLLPGGVIEGRVVDESGEPVVRANVVALRWERRDGQELLARSREGTATNDRGEYRLFGLMPGDYSLSASLPDAQMSFTNDPGRRSANTGSGYAMMYFPGTTDVTEAERVTLKPAQSLSNIDIVFRPVPLARVAGVLVSSEGKLLDGAHVILTRSTSFGGTVGFSRVADTGAFRIDRVPPGRYILQAYSVPRTVIETIARTGRSAPLADAPGLEFGVLPITVTGDVDEITITTAPAGRIRGKVTLDGRPVQPSGGRPMLIRAIPAAPDAIAAGATVVPVQGDGFFSASGMLGRFILRVDQITPPLSLMRVERDSADVTDVGISIGADEDVSDIRVMLTTTPTRLDGRVASRTGSASGEFADSMVLVFSEDAERWSLPATRYVTRTRPDREGSFHVSGLPPGRYLAVALAGVESDRLDDPGLLKRASTLATRVMIGAEQASTTLRIQTLK